MSTTRITPQLRRSSTKLPSIGKTYEVMFVPSKQLLPALFLSLCTSNKNKVDGYSNVVYLSLLKVTNTVVAFAQTNYYDHETLQEHTTIVMAASDTTTTATTSSYPTTTAVREEQRKTLCLRLYLVRHGESVANERGVFAGQLDSPLTEQGMVDARALGVRSRFLPPEPASASRGRGTHDQGCCRFDRVYSSDLVRAHDTCTLILEGLQTRGPIDRNNGAFGSCNVRLDSRLRERSYGTLQGMPWGSNPDETDRMWRDAHGRDEIPPKWESDHDIWVRVKEFLEELVEDELAAVYSSNGGATDDDRGPTQILIASHGGVLRQILLRLVGVDKLKEMGATFDRKRKNKLITPNTSLTILDLVVRGEHRQSTACSNQDSLEDRCTVDGKASGDNDNDLDSLRGVQVKMTVFANTDHLDGEVRIHDD
eukprot:jgi/Psemu1/6771/gm1.6771_g